MKRAIIVYNPWKAQAKWELDLLSRFIEGKGVSCTALRSDRITQVKNIAAFSKYDTCITLGGDGTILRVAEQAAFTGVPVLGINLGSLGFLSEFESDEIYDALDKIIKGNYRIEKRLLLDITAPSLGKNKKFTAVNDCVLRYGPSGRVILLRLKVNGSTVADYIGDGLIVATPTGSTAYSLAAGGPIIHPGVAVFAVTPICPHTLSQRALVVSCDEELCIELPEYKSNTDVMLSIDGQRNYKFAAGSEVTIKKSAKYLKLITDPKKGYFEILRKKLGWGSVPGKTA